MIKEIKIENIDQLLKILSEQEFQPHIERYRSSYIYRGLSNDSFKLVTSLKRNCKDKQEDLEESIIRNFIKYAESDQLRFVNSIWEKIMLAQHHGLPTRMLDWTFSPLVALHFACDASNFDNFDKNNSVIWRVDVDELKTLLPEKYQDKLRENNALVFTADMLNQLANLKSYDADMKDHSMVLIEPPSIDQRIINQYSIFTAIPMGFESIEDFLDKNTEKTIKYVISKDIKWRVRDMLDQININERIMFPGLDGLSLWLKRHYFVKNGDNK